MASFDSVEKAVRLKVEHLKDKAKLDTLSTKLSTEFNAVKDTLRANAAAIPNLIQGFHNIQIHEITKNAEVKEQVAKQQLETKVDELIAMLKNPPAASTQTTDTPASTGTNTASTDTTDTTGTTDTSATPETPPSPSSTETPETTTQTTALSESIRQEARATLESAKTEMANFNPKSINEALGKFATIEQKLEQLILSAGSVEGALPEGTTKTDMQTLKRNLEEYKAEMVKSKGQLEGAPSFTPFFVVEGKLKEAKQVAADLIARFENVLNK